MSEFVRVKVLAYEAGSSSTAASDGPGSEYVAIKILEATKAANGGVELVQKRRTMNQEWNTFFDSHLYDGRVIHMLIMDQNTKAKLADIEVGVHILANYCRQNSDQPLELPLDLSPCGKLLVQLRHFGGSAAPPTLPEVAETANPVDATAAADNSPTDGDGEDDCEVCLVAARNNSIALVPCGHRRFCSSCADEVYNRARGCPICRANITMILRLF